MLLSGKSLKSYDIQNATECITVRKKLLDRKTDSITLTSKSGEHNNRDEVGGSCKCVAVSNIAR